MKKICLGSLICANLLFASIQENINFHSIAFDNSGNILANTTIAIKIELLDSSNNVLYSETNSSIITDSKGLFSLKIGTQTTNDNFSTLNFSNIKKIKVYADLAGGTNYSEMGSQEFSTVPFAFVAKKLAGYNNSANGDYAISFGSETNASGNYSTAFGKGTKANQENMTAIGKYNTLNNTNALFVIGNGNSDSDRNDSLVVTDQNVSVSGKLFVNGSEVISDRSSSDSATILNSSNTSATGTNALAWGSSTNASGNYSTAFGKGTKANQENMTAIGKYNTQSNSNTLFVVGNGNSDSDRNDSLVVTDQNVSISGKLFVNGVEITSGNGSDSATILNSSSTSATGTNAFAWGSDTNASGQYSTAFGYGSIASGVLSTTFGMGVTASGMSSTAWGRSTIALGNIATTWGQYTTASGSYSTAWGNRGIASGSSSTAFGNKTNALGNYSTAFGFETNASGNSSTVWGENTTASGEGSTSWGQGTTASALYATVWGSSAIASGDYSTAWGSSTTASGEDSTSWGQGTTALGGTSTAWGVSTTASGNYSTAWGGSTIASGQYSTAFGSGTVADQIYMVAIGSYNTENNTNALFVVGNGTATSHRSDAFKVDSSGNITYAGTSSQSSDERLKTNIVKIDNAIEKIKGIKGVYFNWIDTKKSQSRQVGVIAQDVEKVVPELVKEQNDGYLSVSYTSMVGLLVEAIKSQQREIEAKNEKIKNLENIQAKILKALSKAKISIEE